MPTWLEWLTWTHLWPFKRERALDRQQVVLPLLPRWQQTDVRLRQLRDATAAAIPLALLVMLARPDGLIDSAAGWTAVVAVVLHLLAAVGGLLLTVEIRADLTGEWVRLSGVHRDFVTEVESRLTRPRTEPLLVMPEPVVIEPEPGTPPDPGRAGGAEA